MKNAGKAILCSLAINLLVIIPSPANVVSEFMAGEASGSFRLRYGVGCHKG